jgi:iron complex outermembrane recepter protein
MKNIFLLILSMLVTYASLGQNGQLKGRVVDATTNTPLAGATIEINGKGATTTNDSGEFSADCSGSAIVRVSYVGYETFSKTADCATELIISLISSIKSLQEVEVTALSNPNRSPLEQPISIVKLGTQELKRSTGLFLDDAINTSVPGVFMERRTISGGQQINIRGYGSGMGFRGISSNFDSQGVKMYLNGIPITDAEGITVMDDVDYGSVNNLEVSKGPSGTLYGLAIAGVVNLQTQKAEKGQTSVGEDFMIGSYGLQRSTTRLAIGGEKSSFLINYGHQKYDGFMPHTKSHKNFVNMMGDYVLNDKQSMTSYLGFSDSYDERNGELTQEQYETFDYSGNSRYIANNAHSAVKTFRAGVGHTYHFNDHISNTTSLFGSAQEMDNSSAGGWTDKTPLNYGFRSTFDKQFKLSEGVTLSGITGVEMQQMEAFTAGYSMGADSTNLSGYNVITAIRSNQATTSSTSSYFTQWTLSLPSDISVTAGIGISNMKLRLEDRLWGLTNDHPGNARLKTYENTYNGLASPNFAINKKISKVASVYASYSVGYKAPVSSNILISTTGQLNTGLEPEKGTQIEIGTKGSMMDNRLFYTVAGFNAKFQDKFTNVTVQNPSNTATLYSYIVNGGSLNNTGLEVLVNYNVVSSNTGFLKLLRPFANLTYSHFTYDNFTYETIGKSVVNQDSTIVNDYSGNAVAGVSPVVFNLGVDVDTEPGLYGNLNFNYRSSMFYTSDEVNETEAYSLLNIKAGFRKSFGHFNLDAYFGANNITGEQYYQMVFVNQIPDAYIPAPNEINFFGGVNLKYTF